MRQNNSLPNSLLGGPAPIKPESNLGTGKFLGKVRISYSVVILLMLLAMLAAFATVLVKVLNAETEAMKREIKSVSRVFESHQLDLLNEIERYAASNAAYVNVETDFNPHWVERRFGADMANDFDHDIALLIGTNDQILFEKTTERTPLANDARQALVRGMAPEVAKIRGYYSQHLSTNEDGVLEFSGSLSEVSTVEVTSINGRIGIVSAFAVVPDPGGIRVKRTPPAILLTVHYLDGGALTSLVSNLTLDNLEFRDAIPDKMIGMPVRNTQGTEFGYLVWHPMSQASSIIVSSIPVLALSIGVIFAIAIIAIRQNALTKQRLSEREKEARFAANHDSMTGFASRAHFSFCAQQRLDSARTKGGSIGLIYLDIDNLKQINDIHGHLAGDELIVSQARRLQGLLGRNDLKGRIGGDEFLILLKERMSEDELRVFLKQIVLELGQPIEINGKQIETSCSIGLAYSMEQGDDLKTLIRKSDIALQRCKQEGRNCFRIFNQEMDETIKEQRQIRQELGEALSRGQFELLYQPIVEARTGKLAFAEALIRWNHPEKGQLPPAIFLDIAQGAGLMPEIGRWVLESAVECAASWHRDLGISVNVCTSQLHEDGFADHVEQILDRYDFSPDRLKLEVTEALMLDHNDVTQAAFDKLRKLGVSLAVDDFGTGYSSLGYLNRHLFDDLKIDRSFVSRIGEDQGAENLLRAQIGLAKIMGMKTIGEGVETEEQKQFLIEHGCDYLQGYFFDRPLSMSDWERRISSTQATPPVEQVS